jgi:hypothetical protein
MICDTLLIDNMELDRFFPFQRIGFECNPFRSLTREEVPRLAIIPEEVKNVCLESAEHLQILGAAGSGKTTLLLGLCEGEYWDDQVPGYEYLGEGDQSYQTDMQALDVFLLDEAQRLDRSSLHRLINEANEGTRLVFSSHRDLSNEFRRGGLNLRSMIIETPSRVQIRDILSKRLLYFSLGDTPEVDFTGDGIDFLFQTFGSDIRTMMDLLYEVFQDLQVTGSLTTSDLRMAIDQYALNAP